MRRSQELVHVNHDILTAAQRIVKFSTDIGPMSEISDFCNLFHHPKSPIQTLNMTVGCKFPPPNQCFIMLTRYPDSPEENARFGQCPLIKRQPGLTPLLISADDTRIKARNPCQRCFSWIQMRRIGPFDSPQSRTPLLLELSGRRRI